MSGGLLQLVATGEQDTWLTGKPEVSFFRSSYKRYTHYSNSIERMLIQGTPAPGGMSTIHFIIQAARRSEPRSHFQDSTTVSSPSTTRPEQFNGVRESLELEVTRDLVFRSTGWVIYTLRVAILQIL